jgi:protein TonB
VRSSDNDILLLALGGTIAIHTILITVLDIVNVTIEHEPPKKAPVVELVEIQLPKPPPPPPPPPKARVEPEQQQRTEPKVRTRVPPVRTQQVQTPPPPPKDVVPDPNSGGAPTIKLDEGLLPTGKIPVAVGKPDNGPVGRGGKGTGTGSGTGDGSAEAPPPPPVSVATIKKRAMPKGDYGYIDAGRDYPQAARQRAIEGAIRVRLVVDDQGKVKSAVLLNKLGFGLDELALERSKKIEFEPARDTDDKPVASVVIWTYNMTLPK